MVFVIELDAEAAVFSCLKKRYKFQLFGANRL